MLSSKDWTMQKGKLFMSNVNVYLKCLRSAKVVKPDVYLKDVCNLRCADVFLSAKLRVLKVWHFEKKAPRRHVVSTLRLVELMEEACPQITVEVIGETDVLIEYEKEERKNLPARAAKITLVCLVSFLGTAFTIMAYHNDIGINAIFTQAYAMLLGEEPKGINAMEVAYSAGVALGMLLFFNHAMGRTITEDPTPIQVAMRNYEKDVDSALVETAERNSMEEENSK